MVETSSVSTVVATQNPRPKPPPLPPMPAQDLIEPESESEPPAQDRQRPHAPMQFGHTPLSAAFRFVEPTWRNYIMYVDMESRAGNADAKRYLDNWRALSPQERKVHFPEQLCELASVSPSDLIRWVSGQAWQEGSAKAAMCLTFMRDRVLEKTAQFAIDSPDNYKHAELFMRAGGLLPSNNGRGGPAVTIFNTPVASSGSVALAGARSESSPVERSGLRDMDSEIVELSRIMQTEGPEPSGPGVPDELDDEEEESGDGDDE